ncbi:zinc finger domain-containing protein [Lysinibacillus sp. NPDC047702]
MPKNTNEMQEIRCKKCGKLLAKVKGEAEIKCPRCKDTTLVNN